MAEEIDLEKCNFWNYKTSATLILTLDQVKITLVHISGPHTHTKLDGNQKNSLWTDRLMYGWTDAQNRVPIY